MVTDTAAGRRTTSGERRGRGAPSWARPAMLGALLVLLVVFPLMSGGFTLFLATEAVVRAIAAVGLAVLIAHAGLLSLGHAAFFGLAGYSVAFLTMHVTASPLLTLTVPLVAAVAYAALTGPLALRSHGIFFVMITLAFAQLLYAVAEQWIEVTRGSDGIAGIPRPDWFDERWSFYLLAVALLVPSLLINYWLGETIARTRNRLWLVVGIAANLAVIGWFKYSLFFYVNLTGGAEPEQVSGVGAARPEEGADRADRHSRHVQPGDGVRGHRRAAERRKRPARAAADRHHADAGADGATSACCGQTRRSQACYGQASA